MAQAEIAEKVKSLVDEFSNELYLFCEEKGLAQSAVKVSQVHDNLEVSIDEKVPHDVKKEITDKVYEFEKRYRAAFTEEDEF